MRCPGNPANETVRSQQEGARSFSIGTFQAIRNPAHHLTGDWNPDLAFHHLAALSQVAYWFRYWNIDRYYSPPPDLNTLIAATRK
ncbi:TIGR02391 family protein [Catenulispora yoronensis]